MIEINKQKIDKLLKEAIKIVQEASDEDIKVLLGDGILDDLLQAIAKPSNKIKKSSIYEYLLQNKNRLSLIAFIRLAIHRNYSIKGKVNNEDCFVSPDHHQWFDDGVMFLQGEKQFEGLIGLYQDGKVKFAIAARDIKPGDEIGPKDLFFEAVEDTKKGIKEKAIPENIGQLDKAIQSLEILLRNRVKDEEQYQQFFEKNPWIFGAQYRKIQSHENLDDKNIPDFTGVRVRDNSRDVIEIKQPFLALFKANKKFRSEFNDSWNQAESYIDFTRQESDYLYRQKGLIFENPICYLIIGYDLTGEQIKEIRRKERINPAITILTYNDVLTFGKNTIHFIKTYGKDIKK